MSAEFAKDYLHGDLREIREVMLGKLGSRMATFHLQSLARGRPMNSVTVRVYVRLYGHVGTGDRWGGRAGGVAVG